MAVATAAWVSHGGPQWLASSWPPSNAFIVGKQGLGPENDKK